jgi:hypothetical protein
LDGISNIQVRFGPFNIPAYYHQKIIEIMGNTTRQDSEGFQLART